MENDKHIVLAERQTSTWAGLTVVDSWEDGGLSVFLYAHCLVCSLCINTDVVCIHHGRYSECNCTASHVSSWAKCTASTEWSVRLGIQQLGVREEAIPFDFERLGAPHRFVPVELVEWDLLGVSGSCR